MSQLSLPDDDEPTSTQYQDIIGISDGWRSREETSLSHEDYTFEQLLRLGNLNYKIRIRKHIQEFKEFQEQKNEYYEMEDLPKISKELYSLVDDFLKTIYEKLVNNNIVIPLFDLSYYEGRNGSIDLQVDTNTSNFLINISKKGIIYTFLDKNDTDKIRKGTDKIASIYKFEFYESLVRLISEFES